MVLKIATVFLIVSINPGSNTVGNAKLVADSLTLHFLFMGNCRCHSAHDHMGNEFFNVLSELQHGGECCFSVSTSCEVEILFSVWGIETDRNSVISRLLIRDPWPFVFTRMGISQRRFASEATILSVSKASVGSPNPQKTSFSYLSMLNALKASITSSKDGSCSSQSVSDFPTASSDWRTQNVHAHEQRLVRFTYRPL